LIDVEYWADVTSLGELIEDAVGRAVIRRAAEHLVDVGLRNAASG
jgi:hypothetical protein